MNKQQQIEEMAKIINGSTELDTIAYYRCMNIAKTLYNAGYRKIDEDTVSTSRPKVFDILDKIEFFQGQRAGRELWFDKPKEVQDQDLADFVKDIKYIRSYLKDSVVLSREELSKKYVSRDTYDAEIKYRKVLEKRACKETVEKFAKGLIKIIKEKDTYLDWDDVLEFAKQFGVEIKE